MKNLSHERTIFLGLGVSSLSLLIAGAALSPSGATVRPRVPGVQTLRTYGSGIGVARSSSRRGRSYTVAPSPCPTNATAGTFFVGIPDAADVAGADDSGVLAGTGNNACDAFTAIGAGASNVVGKTGLAEYSFIGGGQENAITSAEAFVGSGYMNEAAQNASFVGAGFYGVASGAGSFVGAGGGTYDKRPNAIAGGGNAATATDSFVGAGDLNVVTSAGAGSFIGGGGTGTAAGSATVNNQISGTDAFIGAGDSNEVTASHGFVGAGTGNAAVAANGFVGGGGYNTVGMSSGFVGAGADNEVNGADAFVGAGGGEFYAKHGAGVVQNSADGTDSFVGAGDLNVVTGNGSFIGAGGYTYASTGVEKTGNSIAGNDSFIGAGTLNTISGTEGFIGSGGYNAIGANASYASIIGGNYNTANGEYASVIGGFNNTASGNYGIVAGGDTSTAAGTVSFAAGYHADAAHNGSFVWSDYVSGSTPVKDTATNQFVVRASGGTYVYSNEAATTGVSLPAGSGTWASLSDRNAKTDVVPVDDASVLAKVAALPVTTWRYKSESGVRHVGPMAQDFYSAFAVGEDNRHITSIDEDGVALAAIKALHAENARLRSTFERKDAEKDASIRALSERVSRLDSIVAKLLAKRI